MTPRLSVVVLTYNRSDALLVVLRALAQQCTADDEVIVADDGSQPEHVARLFAECPKFSCAVRHVWHPDIGFTASRARNLGVAASTGAYLIFLDGDCVPHPNFLAQHRRLMAVGCFVNGSRVLLSPYLTQQALSGAVTLGQLTLWRWLVFRWQGHANKWLWLLGMRCSGTRMLASWLARKRRMPRFVWKGIRSCNLGVWRADFETVNGFDETFAGWGHEDADLVLRLHHAGLTRTNGFWATEVFHLHHPEYPRANEGINRQRVVDRMASDIVAAAQGLLQLNEEKYIEIKSLYAP